jgi:hypothetical protein
MLTCETVGKGKGNIGHGELARDRETGRYGTLMHKVYGPAWRQEGSVILEALGRAGPKKNPCIFSRSIVADASKRKEN